MIGGAGDEFSSAAIAAAPGEDEIHPLFVTPLNALVDTHNVTVRTHALTAPSVALADPADVDPSLAVFDEAVLATWRAEVIHHPGTAAALLAALL